MNFSTHCVECKKCVMASTTLDTDELLSALEDNAEVEVFHVSDNRSDHRWQLDEEEKLHLLSRMRRDDRKENANRAPRNV